MKQSMLFQKDEPPTLQELDLKKAEALANQVTEVVQSRCTRIEVAGSIRRQRPKVHDVDFVVATENDAQWQKINQDLKKLKAKPSCSGKSVIKTYLPTKNGFFQVDFYRAQPKTFGILLLVRTGSAEHNTWLACHAMSMDLRIKYSQGLLKEGKVIAGADEEGVFAALGLPCPVPPEREISESSPIWLTKEHQLYEKIWQEIKNK